MLGDAVRAVQLVPPQAVTATMYGYPLDVREVATEEMLITVAVGAITGTPTLDIKIQESPSLARGLNVITPGSTFTVLRNNTNDNVNLAAKWTQSGQASIKKMTLFLKNNGTITAGKILTLTINADSAGSPGSAIGTADTILCSAVPAAGAFITFTFATPVNVSDATVYHAVLDADYTLSSSNNITWRSKTVASGGNQEIKDSAWAAAVATEALEIYAEQYVFTDVSGLTLSQITTGSVVRRLPILTSQVARHFRPVLTVGGGTPNMLVCVMAHLEVKRKPAVTQ